MSITVTFLTSGDITFLKVHVLNNINIVVSVALLISIGVILFAALWHVTVFFFGVFFIYGEDMTLYPDGKVS